VGVKKKEGRERLIVMDKKQKLQELQDIYDNADKSLSSYEDVIKLRDRYYARALEFQEEDMDMACELMQTASILRLFAHNVKVWNDREKARRRYDEQQEQQNSRERVTRSTTKRVTRTRYY